MISRARGNSQDNGVREQGTGENIWPEEKRNSRKLEETA
jgi:hypothetical protein